MKHDEPQRPERKQSEMQFTLHAKTIPIRRIARQTNRSALRDKNRAKVLMQFTLHVKTIPTRRIARKINLQKYDEPQCPARKNRAKRNPPCMSKPSYSQETFLYAGNRSRSAQAGSKGPSKCIHADIHNENCMIH